MGDGGGPEAEVEAEAEADDLAGLVLAPGSGGSSSMVSAKATSAMGSRM
jgi:hypothetical protein